MRPIDDGARQAHNEMVQCSETLGFPSFTQPAVQLRALVAAFDRPGVPVAQFAARAETGEQEMLDSSRFAPIAQEEIDFSSSHWRACIPEGLGHFLGNSAAVFNFHQLQRPLTAASQGLFVLLVASTYDGATLQGFNPAQAVGQRNRRLCPSARQSGSRSAPAASVGSMT